MRRVVSLYLPTWPTDRLRTRTDVIRDKPLVTAGTQGSRRVLMAVDDAASRLGLKPGMTVAHAQALVSDLITIEADTTGDVAGLEALTTWLLRHYSPIAVPDPPDSIVIDSTGCDHLFGGEDPMLAELHTRLSRRGIAVRIAVADTPGAAWGLARYAESAISIVREGGTRDALRPLPVAALRLPPDIVTGLSDLGFSTIGQLLDAPRPSLAVRFGRTVGQRLDRALGTAADPIEPHTPESLPRHRLALAEPIADLASIERVTQDLARLMAADLESRGLGARALDLRFERVDRSMQALRIGLAQPSRDERHFSRLWCERLDSVDPGFGIDAVSLIASHTEPLPPSQLASHLDEPDVSTASELVDRLTNLPCVRRVLRFAPYESDIPERSLRRLPALAPPSSHAWPPWPRPTRLLHPPEPIEATPPDAPDQFVWRGRTHRVLKLDGPERVHGEWWRDISEVLAQRDYYRVEDETGAQFWLVRTSDHWRLHGLFG